jgi:SAM-dependent methyltransferase
MTAAAGWHQTFFTGVTVDFWLQAVPADQTRQEVDFLATALRPPPGGRLLDVPCGGGRHGLALASRGFRLTGVDSSTEFLAAARAAPGADGVTWEQRDMRDLPWPAAFDAAYCMGNSFGYLDDAGHADFLRAVAASLKPGGRFVLDAACLEIVLPFYLSMERTWAAVGDLLFLQERRYDCAEGVMQSDYTFVRDGRAEKRTAWHRFYAYRELVRMLTDAGFADVQGVGSLAGEPFRLGARRLLLKAAKAT